MRVGATTLASLNGQMPPNTPTPRKPKIDALLRTRGLTTPGPVSSELSNVRPFPGFSFGGSTSTCGLSQLPRPPMYFPTWVPAARAGCWPGCRPAGEVELASSSSPARPGTVWLWLNSANRTEPCCHTNTALSCPFNFQYCVSSSLPARPGPVWLAGFCKPYRKGHNTLLTLLCPVKIAPRY